jgi:hypothetical protein
MKRILLYVACSIPIISMILLIMCGELPTDPKDDPDNVNVTFFTSSSGINYQDQPVEIGMSIRYPALTKKIRIAFADTLPKETLYCDTKQNGNYDTVKTIRTFSDTGKKTMNVDVDLTNGSVKQFSYEFEITPKLLTVSFDTIPPNGTIETGKPDTMTFTASTSPAGGAIDFTVESQPVLNSSNLKIIDLGSKAVIITTATYDTTYTITVIAKSGTATKSTMVKLKSEKKSILQEKSSVTTMSSGTSDTLVFTIGAMKSDTISSLVFLNSTAFKSGEIVPVATGKDTLSFVFTPAETKVYLFSVEVATNHKKDTLSYTISVTKEPTLLLKQDTVTISTTEGNVLNLPIVPYLADTTVQLSADKGSVSSKALVYTVPSSTTRDTIIVTAQKDSTISRIKIYLNISKSDTSKFTITYLGNGSTGGTVPVDTATYVKSAKVTITGNTGLLVKTGATFAGWNTIANGAGTAYLVGSELTMGSANVILYAQWTTNPTFTVTYFGNESTAGSVPVDVNKYETGAPVTIAAVGSLAKAGFTFAGWNTAADGSGTLRVAGSSFPIGNTDVSLYARWVVTTVQPSIVTQPVSQTVCTGLQVSFSVTASGTTPLTYQWRKGATSFTDIPNATGAIYSFTPASSDNATILSCLVSNGGTVNAASNPCTLTVNTVSTKPTTAATPASICPGESSVLSVTAGSLGTGATWKWYTSKTSATALTSTTVSPSASSWYYAKGTGGSCGDSPWDSIYITVNNQSVTPTSIAVSTATVCMGSSVILTLTGGTLGTGATTWQWFTDALCTQPAAGIPNTDGSQFTVTPSSNTTYYVKAIGTCNTTTAVSKAINISAQSSAPTAIAASTPNVCPGNPVTLSVSGGSLGSDAKWKWYTNPLFTIAAVGTSTDISGSPITVTPSLQTTYYVRAEGTCGNTTGANRTINVYTPPVITTPLVGGEVCQPGEGSSGNYDVSATGNAPLTYSWYTSTGTDLGSSHNSYISISAPAAGNIDFYCVVSDVNGCSTKSNTVTQTAHQPIEITSQPTDTFGYVGYNYTFAVIATGYGTLNYQWQYQLQDLTWASLPLGTNASVATQGYLDGYNQDGNWNIKIRCKITNSLGCEIYSRNANLHVWGI